MHFGSQRSWEGVTVLRLYSRTRSPAALFMHGEREERCSVSPWGQHATFAWLGPCWDSSSCVWVCVFGWLGDGCATTGDDGSRRVMSLNIGRYLLSLRKKYKYYYVQDGTQLDLPVLCVVLESHRALCSLLSCSPSALQTLTRITSSSQVTAAAVGSVRGGQAQCYFLSWLLQRKYSSKIWLRAASRVESPIYP